MFAIAPSGLDAPNKFGDPGRLKDGMRISDVALIIDFHKDVLPPVVQNPAGGVICGTNDGRFVAKAVVLSKIEIANNHREAEFIGFIENSSEPICVVTPE